MTTEKISKEEVLKIFNKGIEKHKELKNFYNFELDFEEKIKNHNHPSEDLK